MLVPASAVITARSGEHPGWSLVSTAFLGIFAAMWPLLFVLPFRWMGIMPESRYLAIRMPLIISLAEPAFGGALIWAKVSPPFTVGILVFIVSVTHFALASFVNKRVSLSRWSLLAGATCASIAPLLFLKSSLTISTLYLDMLLFAISGLCLHGTTSVWLADNSSVH
jgi:hypothetical protein